MLSIKYSIKYFEFVSMLYSLVLVVNVMHFFKYITLVLFVGFYILDAITLCYCIGWVLDMQMILCIELISLHVRMFIPCVNKHCGHYL